MPMPQFALLLQLGKKYIWDLTSLQAANYCQTIFSLLYHSFLFSLPHFKSLLIYVVLTQIFIEGILLLNLKSSKCPQECLIAQVYGGHFFSYTHTYFQDVCKPCNIIRNQQNMFSRCPIKQASALQLQCVSGCCVINLE